MLGKDNGCYNYMMCYNPPPRFFMRSEEIVPDGWDGMEDLENDEMVGMIGEGILNHDLPAVEDINHLGRDQTLHLRLSILEEDTV